MTLSNIGFVKINPNRDKRRSAVDAVRGFLKKLSLDDKLGDVLGSVAQNNIACKLNRLSFGRVTLINLGVIKTLALIKREIGSRVKVLRRKAIPKNGASRLLDEADRSQVRESGESRRISSHKRENDRFDDRDT